MLPTAQEIYLPIVISEPLVPVRLGVQVDEHIPDLEKWIIPNRMYQLPARWEMIEEERGAYQIPANLWSDADKIRPNPWILGTKTCPHWARLWPNLAGSPPLEEFWPDYAAFLNHMIDELHPWGVEIWNEPDTQPQFAIMSYFGAWIPDDGNPYLAGWHYGKFCQTIYPLIKQAHPETQVIVGALMGELDFLRGAVAAGMRGDLLSVHHYLRPTDDFDDTFVVIENVQRISGMPVILTETSIMGLEDTEELRDMQADYLDYLCSRQDWEGIPLLIWYSLGNLWNYTSLIRGGRATPAYLEFARNR